MAINKAIIQIRRGLKDDLQFDKLLPGELAIATDAPCMWFCWAVGEVEQIPTSDNIEEVIAKIIEEYLKDNPVVGISEIYMRVYEGYIQYSSDGETYNNLISVSELKGAKGDPGSAGVGIRTIKQTTKSSEDGGTNVITITLSNGTKATFEVLNGQKGSPGNAGVGIQSISQQTGNLNGGKNTIQIVLTNGNVQEVFTYNGKNGSDANVTLANIVKALGFTPASEEFVNNQVSTIPKFELEVVDSLPTANIKETTVYLLKSGDENGNLYTEYIYKNGKWEKLGSQTLDLSKYAEKSTTLKGYGITDGATKEEVEQLSQEIVYYSNYVTPQIFGAVGDGVADDTEAIQEAFDTGEIIYFPSGRYKVTSQLNVTRPCKISMYKPYPCAYQGDYPLTADDNYMGARIETYATNGYGILIGDGVEIDGFYMRAMDAFEGVLFKFDGTLGKATYPSRVRLSHIILDNNSIYTVPESMFDFVPNGTYFHLLDDITIGSLRGRQFCEYGFRSVMTTKDTNWANSVRIRNLCIDILADYPFYIEGGAKGCENWVFENPSIQTYPYDATDETYLGKSGHIDIVTMKNMQNPLILGGDIYDLHAASYGRIFNIVNTPNISTYGSNKWDEIDTNLKGKLQEASDNLNIAMLEMSVERDETTGDSTLVLTDGTREKSVKLPSATMTDEQVSNGVSNWLDENSKPVVAIGKNKFNVMDADTVNGEYYFSNGNLVFESNTNMTTSHFIKAKENDRITVSLNGNKVGFYAIIYYDKNKNPLERVSTQSASSVSHVVTNTKTAFVRLLFTQGTLVYANRANTKIMILVNNESSLAYEAYTETIEDGTFTKIVEESVSDYLADNPIEVNNSIVDEGDYYESTDVEGALQEVGGSLKSFSEQLVLILQRIEGLELNGGNNGSGGDTSSYTNVIPTSTTLATTTEVFNSTGYKNNAYITSEDNKTEPTTTSNAEVISGFFPVSISPSSSPVIYMKGVTFDSSQSHCRMSAYNTQGTYKYCAPANWSQCVTVEELATQYYKLTFNGTAFSDKFGTITHLRLSAIGSGENWIVSVGNPIE